MEEAEASLSERCWGKSRLLIKEASPASALGWSDRTAGSMQEAEEEAGEAEVHEVHPVVAPAGPVTEVVAIGGRSAATGPPRKIGSDGIL